MQIIILDRDFETLGVVPVYNTLIWTRRYYEPGVFELHAPSEYFELMTSGAYVYRNDRTELGVISEADYTQDDSGGRQAYVKGNFAECLLNRRVIDTTYSASGTPEAIARGLVDKYIISPSDSARIIPHIVLGDLAGIGENTELQTTGDALGDKIADLLETQEQAYRLVYDYIGNVLSFEVYQGKDRTDEQRENSWAIFSDKFYNIKSAVYYRDDSLTKNYAYVAGEDSGASRTIVEVDLSGDDERRELYVDARDLQSEYTDDNGNQRTYSASEYKDMLRQRGLEKLASYAVVETVTSEIDADANLVYRTDFDVGDLCVYRNYEIGIEAEKRITEISETYEGAATNVTVTFGNDSQSSVTKLIQREVS